MNVIESINSRRSVRSFTDRTIPSDVVDQLIALGTKAATGSGNEPWGFVVITDKNEMKELSVRAKKYWLDNMAKFPYIQQYESWLKNDNFNIFYNAPCLLIIYGDTNSHWYVYDGTLAAGNIMLAAGEFGLGTCWIGFAEQIFDDASLKSKFNIPDHYKLVCPLVVGYPKGQLPPPSRKPAPVFFLG